MSQKPESLTELANRSIGLSGRFDDVGFFKREIDQQIAFGVFAEDIHSSPCYHLPMEAISSDEHLSMITGRVTAAIIMSRLGDEDIRLNPVDRLAGTNPREWQDIIAHRTELLKVARVPFMAFRNTLMLMGERPSKFKAEDIVRVGAHGFSYLQNLVPFENNEYAREAIIHEMDKASSMYEFQGDQESAAKVLYAAFQMRHWLAFDSPSKYKGIVTGREKLQRWGFTGKLNLEDKNPRLEAGDFMQTAEPSEPA